jgi:hypothetical protein
MPVGLCLAASGGRLSRPEIIVADDEAGLRVGKGQAAKSPQEFVECGVFRVHFGPLHCIDDNGSRIDCPMRALRSRNKPIVMLRGHQHELSSAMPCDLDRLSPSLMLELTEVSLKLQGRSSCHAISQINNKFVLCV